jgi:hypothetical protein
MSHNSHNPTINESMKPWSRKLSQQEYDLRVLTAEEFKHKYGLTSAAYNALLKELQCH